MTLGSPLASPAAAGCHVPVDRRQRVGESACQKTAPSVRGARLGPSLHRMPGRRGIRPSYGEPQKAAPAGGLGG
jgi:hypothetical protein